MNLRDVTKVGHWPTLLAAFLYFDFSFMVWVSLGPTIIYITKQLNLPVEEKFTLVAIPILAGSLIRIILGALADHIGSKRTGIIGQIIVIVAVAITWQLGLQTKAQVELLGIALGVAGASFAVALPQASRWYPPQYQGLVMGITGAGNMGVVLETLTAPGLAERFGWQNAYGFLLIPLVLTLIYYCLAAKDAQDAREPVTWSNYRELLKDRDSWWFMFFYFITFGGFVGLGNALPLYFTVQYHLSGVAAGFMVALTVTFGSGFRPIGGWLADRIGGVKSLLAIFSFVAMAYFTVAYLPPGPAPAAGPWTLLQIPGVAWIAVACFSAGMIALGMGNGAVFQLIPQRFRHEIGVMTGLVGCAGGIGGFLLAKTLGVSQGNTGGFTAGFLCFSILAVLGLVGLVLVKMRWRTTWGALSGARI